jgi:hypothetical protein
MSNAGQPYTAYFAQMKKKFALNVRKPDIAVAANHHSHIKAKIETLLRNKAEAHREDHRARSSMEEVELLELQIELYLAEMKQKYIEYQAKDIVVPVSKPGSTYRRFLVDVLQASVNRAKLIQKFN